MGYYYAAFSLFREYGSTCLSSVTFWKAIPTFWLSDADTIKTVHTSRAIFPKDVEAYETINIYGQNMVGTEGAEWKRHRSVANSAFNKTNNAFVWRETNHAVAEWFTQIGEAKPDSQGGVFVDLLKDLTQVTLLVISSADHKIAFRPAVTATLHHVITKAVTPTWLSNLSDRLYLPLITPLLNEARGSFDALRLHMLEVISLARAWIAGGKASNMDAALLRNLVEANMSHNDNGKHLTDDELLSNTFVSIRVSSQHYNNDRPPSYRPSYLRSMVSIACTRRHTSPHYRSRRDFGAFALLRHNASGALPPTFSSASMKKLFDYGPTVPPPRVLHPYVNIASRNFFDLSYFTQPYKESMAKLEYTTAVFHETLRLFPPVARLAKHVHADTTLSARRFRSSPEGKVTNVEKLDVPVRSGSIVIIDMRRVFASHANDK
ncbi:hypothetical protein D9615_005915 [Tricholomella constricta]|uniref:Cytochrome P450 n=1 Tax=Tricholomella constricta TaxID=117010 RepID=A0A8H5M336_9AGAR|nr:hypothetical protein D9615_005915 [Tricholomella constricta]